MKTLKTKTFKGTWMGKPGVSTAYHLDKRDTGLRVCLMEMEGELPVARLIEGDGRMPGFKVYAEGVLPPPDQLA